MGFHWQELIVVLVIVLVLFGPRRLPEIGRSLGSGIREFRESFTASPGSARTSDERIPVAVEVESTPADDTTATR